MPACRWWADLACWGYVLFMVLLFLVCKLLFLLVSWRFPEFYLRYRDVL
jgi:hypothetical protein